MATLSPYRSLPAERRIALVTHAIQASKEGRQLFVARLLAKGGGFRPVTLQSWNADRLAREVVRLRAETPQDEFDLLHLLYVELDPSVQTTFLEAAGVRHEGGKLPDDLELPYCDAGAVTKGAAAVRAKHGEDGERYLRTLARYNRDGWPGIETLVTES
jgi:hypothetical protein